jgi:hypothetical protein
MRNSEEVVDSHKKERKLRERKIKHLSRKLIWLRGTNLEK